jgi:hypothetical protein
VLTLHGAEILVTTAFIDTVAFRHAGLRQQLSS